MTTPRLLSIQDLHVRIGNAPVVKGVTLDVASGETVALVGESGSGKSQAMLAVAGLSPRNAVVSGSVCYQGQELIGLSSAAWRKVHGSHIGFIFQDAGAALDPFARIGRQISDALQAQTPSLTRARARLEAIACLQRAGMPDPEQRVDAYSHQLSGGQRQRAMIALALARGPRLVIADEPTTALDVVAQADVLTHLTQRVRQDGQAMVFITHDLALVRRFAQRAFILQEGRIVEHGPTESLLAHPQESYTRTLVNAVPQARKTQPSSNSPVLLDVQNLRLAFQVRRKGIFGKPHSIQALDDVSLQVRAGETLGIVGESGSGKSTLGRALLKVLSTSGLVSFDQHPLHLLSCKTVRPLRRNLQAVFQDPYNALSPRFTSGEIVAEGLKVHEPHLSSKDRDKRVAEVFAAVGLDPAWCDRRAHAFSGGQRQRLAIARAIILKPKLIILDEPTSALDRSVQAQIIDFLHALQAEHGMAYILISHDFAVVRSLADRLLVMKDGKIIEQGTLEAVLTQPQHLYTRRLIEAAGIT